MATKKKRRTTVVVGVSMTKKVLERLDFIAQREARTRSGTVALMVQRYVLSPNAKEPKPEGW